MKIENFGIGKWEKRNNKKILVCNFTDFNNLVRIRKDLNQLFLQPIKGKKEFEVLGVVEEITDVIQQPSIEQKIDPTKLLTVSWIEDLLKASDNNLAQFNQTKSISDFQVFSINFLAVLLHSCFYLVKNKNYFIFTDWLSKNQKYSNELRSLVLSTLAPLSNELGGNL